VRTVVAGIALTGAITMGGLLLVRGRRRLLLVAGLIVSAGVVASIASADLPPFRRPKPRPTDPPQIVVPAGGLTFPVVVEIVDDGPVQLTLPVAPPAQPKPVSPPG
jgi:hypothetical protein